MAESMNEIGARKRPRCLLKETLLTRCGGHIYGPSPALLVLYTKSGDLGISIDNCSGVLLHTMYSVSLYHQINVLRESTLQWAVRAQLS